jgi:hypothetical protein
MRTLPRRELGMELDMSQRECRWHEPSSNILCVESVKEAFPNLAAGDISQLMLGHDAEGNNGTEVKFTSSAGA